ncbi:MAG: hypothetical protein Q8R44_12825 [Novosphingobium sp.]|nr:hypothetical protein [Novosphingobium sp.]
MSTVWFVLALSQAASGVVTSAPLPLEGPLIISSSDVRAHNANLKPNDPEYIRCVKTVVIGSLVKKRAACRTNASWQRVEELGNRNARNFVDDMSKNYNNGR